MQLFDNVTLNWGKTLHSFENKTESADTVFVELNTNREDMKLYSSQSKWNNYSQRGYFLPKTVHFKKHFPMHGIRYMNLDLV